MLHSNPCGDRCVWRSVKVGEDKNGGVEVSTVSFHHFLLPVSSPLSLCLYHPRSACRVRSVKAVGYVCLYAKMYVLNPDIIPTLAFKKP